MSTPTPFTPPRRPQRLPAPAAALLAVLVLPAAVRAQIGGSVTLQGGEGWVGTSNDVARLCSFPGTTGTQSCTVTSANGGALTFTARASAADGVLRSYGRIDAVDYVTDSRGAWTYAGAFWNDALRVASSVPAGLTARITVNYDGVPAGAGHPTTMVDVPMSRWDGATAWWQPLTPVAQTNPWLCCTHTYDGSRQYSSITYDLPLATGDNAFIVQLRVTPGLWFTPGEPLTGFAELDYWNTARIAGIRLFDNGVDVTAAQSGNVSLASGLGIVATPEPGTWMLLGTGLLALGGVARRRRAGGTT